MDGRPLTCRQPQPISLQISRMVSAILSTYLSPKMRTHVTAHSPARQLSSKVRNDGFRFVGVGRVGIGIWLGIGLYAPLRSNGLSCGGGGVCGGGGGSGAAGGEYCSSPIEPVASAATATRADAFCFQRFPSCLALSTRPSVGAALSLTTLQRLKASYPILPSVPCVARISSTSAWNRQERHWKVGRV